MDDKHLNAVSKWELLEQDEFNLLRALCERYEDIAESEGVREQIAREAKDSLFDYLTDLYILGYLCEGESLELTPSERSAALAAIESIAGKSYIERVDDAVREESISTVASALTAIAASDGHRVFCAGQYDALADAESAGYTVTKVWSAELDDKTRLSHSILNGEERALDEYFVSISGARALRPGEFGVASEDCNCRCILIGNIR